MKTIKLFAFLMAMAIATPVAAQQVKVLGKSGSTSTATAKKSATPKQSTASYSNDFTNEGWQGGAGIVYQIADNFNAFGLYGRVMYGINEEMRLSLMDEFYFKDGLSYLDNFDFDFHYLFNVADNIHVYPLGGATIQLSKSKDVTMTLPDVDNNGNIIYTNQTIKGESMSAFGLNFGCGVQYAFTDQVAICAEAKYRFYFKENYKGQFVLGAGVIYKF
ncbi:MAG: outer membrane beta-barrel protein [Prevotella sp.]|nr:outer membrane beta-barrel protein [Prevotella sp.]